MMKIKNQAFTLIELLVVVLIIGILAAVAVPQYQKAIIKSRYAKLKPLVKAFVEAEEIYYLTNDKYTTDADLLTIDWPTIPLSKDVQETAGRYDFDWGYCSINLGKAARVTCEDNQFSIRYAKYFQHTEKYPNMQRCSVLASSQIGQQICEQESSLSSPSEGPTSQNMLNYYW